MISVGLACIDDVRTISIFKFNLLDNAKCDKMARKKYVSQPITEIELYKVVLGIVIQTFPIFFSRDDQQQLFNNGFFCNICEKFIT